jgi:glutamyl-tRNA synthetase
VTLAGGPSFVEFKDMPRHKKNPAVGTKRTAYASTIILDQQDAQTFKDNEEVILSIVPETPGGVDNYSLPQVTLMDWGNAIVRKIKRSTNGIIQGIEMQLHLEGDFKKTEKKITWLATSADAPGLVPVTLVDFDYLITKKKIEEDEDWENFITPQTEFRTDALIDSNAATLEPGTIVQFERKGFYILDSVRKNDDGSVAGADLFLIPDGKAATVASKAEVKATAPTATTANKGSVSAPESGREAASTVSMYKVKPVYGDGIGTGEGSSASSVSMYAVKAVYD